MICSQRRSSDLQHASRPNGLPFLTHDESLTVRVLFDHPHHLGPTKSTRLGRQSQEAGQGPRVRLKYRYINPCADFLFQQSHFLCLVLRLLLSRGVKYVASRNHATAELCHVISFRPAKKEAEPCAHPSSLGVDGLLFLAGAYCSGCVFPKGRLLLPQRSSGPPGLPTSAADPPQRMVRRFPEGVCVLVQPSRSRRKNKVHTCDSAKAMSESEMACTGATLAGTRAQLPRSYDVTPEQNFSW